MIHTLVLSSIAIILSFLLVFCAFLWDDWYYYEQVPTWRSIRATAVQVLILGCIFWTAFSLLFLLFSALLRL